MRRRLGIAVLIAAAGASRGGASGRPGQEPAAPQPPQVPTFGATLELVLVDAVVTDRQGRTVGGLTAADFVVHEDGVPQALTSFEAVDRASAAGAPPAPTPRGPSTNQADPPPGRVFMVVIDDASLSLDGAAAARQVAMRFLSETPEPGDLVSVLLPGSGLVWSARVPGATSPLASIVASVKGGRAQAPELTGDWEALVTAQALDPLAQERARVRLDSSGQLPRATRFPGDSDEEYEARNRALQEPFVQADSRRLLERDRDRRRRLFESVSSAVDAVAAVKGRKSVLLVSEGFVHEPGAPGHRELVAALRRGNASIYFLDVGRLRSGMAADSRQPGDRSASTRVAAPLDAAGAEALAEETGGLSLRNPNDLDAGLARIARESASYYLLGYSPTNAKRDGRYRRLRIELRRPDLELRARRGYFAPSEEKPQVRSAGAPREDPDLARALTGPLPEAGIPLRLTAFTLQPVGKRKLRVRLAAEVGVRSLRFEPAGEGFLGASLEVALAMNHVEPAGRQRTPWREWSVRIPRQADGAELWVPLEADFDVPAGAAQARLAVRDRRSRALGSVVHAFEVPDASGFRVSTPILSEVPADERGRPPRVRVGRSFVASAPLYCYLEVYGGAEKQAAAARASLAWSLVDARGKSRSSRPAAPIEPGQDGIPSRLEAVPLSGLAPGEYELRLVVRDEASGRTQELREPFVVRRPTRPDLSIYVELVQTFLAGDVARASAGVMEWRASDLEPLAGRLPQARPELRRAALLLHTALAFRLWSNARGVEAEAQIALARALLADDAPRELHRDWLLALGYQRLSAGSPLTALPFFEECQRRFPDVAEAWLGAGICYEVSAHPAGFALAAVTAQSAARHAERCYREAARLDPRLAEARLRLGRVLATAGALDEAERELAAAAEASSDPSLLALARVFRGGVRDARGDLAGAIGDYEEALAADRECQTAALALGEALHRSGRRAQAAAALSEALAASSSSEISPWHAYHVGAGRWKALLSLPQEPGPIAAAPPAIEPEQP